MTEPELVEVSREELLRQRANLLERIDLRVKVALDDVDFLLGWYAGAPSIDELRAEIEQLKTEIQRLRSLQTLGGERPPYNAPVWINRRLPGGPDPEYRGI